MAFQILMIRMRTGMNKHTKKIFKFSSDVFSDTNGCVFLNVIIIIFLILNTNSLLLVTILYWHLIFKNLQRRQE